MDLEGGAQGSYFVVPIFLTHKGLPPGSDPFFLLCSSSFFFLQDQGFWWHALGLGYSIKDPAPVAGLAVCVAQ